MKLEDGDPANVTKLICDVHTGTHVDAPLHVLPNGNGIDQLELSKLIGDALVVELTGVHKITSKILADIDIPASVKRLLIKTRNSAFWQHGEASFHADFVALTSDAAQWMVNHKIWLVGIDYLSIQRFNDPQTTHEILLKAGIVILEGIDLSTAEPGTYDLICLPIKLAGADGAPARAVLRKQ